MSAWRRVAIGLAIGMPIAVLGAAAGRFGGWLSSGDAVSGLTGHARGLATTLRGTDPQVVVLGSSLANRGIDTTVLAEALGVDPARVVKLPIPHATSAHHYAVLDNRVFEAGYHPSLVIVADALRPMLTHELLAEPEGVSRLAEQLSGDEAELARRVFGTDDPVALGFGRWRAVATSVREDVLDGWRDGAIQAVFRPRGGRRGAQGLVDRVNDGLFAGVDPAVPDGAGTSSAWTSASPVVGDGFDLRTHGMLGPLDALADAHGAKLVLARMPLPPSNAGTDFVPDALEAQARSWMDELDVGYIDLRGVSLSEADFEDMRHLSPRGARIVSRVLGEAVRGLDARGGAGVEVGDPVAERPSWPSLPEAGCVREVRVPWMAGLADVASVAPEVPWPVVVQADGAPIGRGSGAPCSGTWTVRGDSLVVAPTTPSATVSLAWSPVIETAQTGEPVAWIAPGASLRWPWTGEAVVRGRARAVGAPAALDLGDEAVVAEQGRARIEVQAQDGVTLHNPSATGWWLVHHLAVGEPPTTRVLLGRAETLASAGVRLAGGRIDDTKTLATARTTPPPVEVVRVDPLARRVALRIPSLAPLADTPDPRWPRTSRCSPLVATLSGQELGPRHAPCDDVATVGGGTTCHAGPVLWTSPPEADAVGIWGARLSDDRSCEVLGQGDQMAIRGAWWLYPGDEVAFTVPPERLGAFRDGARSVTVETRTFLGDADAPIGLSLEVDGEAVWRTDWRPVVGPPGARGARFALPEALPPSARDVVMRWHNTSPKRFVLVVAAVLSEAPGPSDLVLSGAPVPVSSAVREGALPDLTPTWRPWPAQNGVAARVPALRALSEGPLASLTPPVSSPVVVRDAQGPLRRVDSLEVFGDGCRRCAVHKGPNLAARGEGAVTVALSADFPAVVGAWWLHPRQIGRWRLGVAPSSVRVVQAAVRAWPAGRVVDPEGVVLRVGAQEVSFGPLEADGVRRARLEVDEGLQDATIEVVERDGEAHVLVTSLAVGLRGEGDVLRPVDGFPEAGAATP